MYVETLRGIFKYCALFPCGKFMWDRNISKHALLVVFPKMSGIVNSSQYCYFNSLIQCLSNISRFQGLLEEHTSTLEEGEGMKLHYSVNIQCK